MLSAAHCLSLTAIGMANGLAALWVFARLSDQKQIDIAKRKLRAHLNAFRLFVDEPALIFRAQKQLLIWNGRYLALVLVPAIIIGIPTLDDLEWTLSGASARARDHHRHPNP